MRAFLVSVGLLVTAWVVLCVIAVSVWHGIVRYYQCKGNRP